MSAGSALPKEGAYARDINDGAIVEVCEPTLGFYGDVSVLCFDWSIGDGVVDISVDCLRPLTSLARELLCIARETCR